MKKVALYSLAPGEQFKIQNIIMEVTATKQIVKEGSNTYQNIYCKQVGGNQFVHAPAGLMVLKVE